MGIFSHQIGHVLVGYGHPNDEDDQGPAPLPGTEKHSHLRLMSNGANSSSFSRLLVKGEWDEAEIWLKRVIDGEGNQ